MLLEKVFKKFLVGLNFKIGIIFILRIFVFKICIRVMKSLVVFDCNLYFVIFVFIYLENFSFVFI